MRIETESDVKVLVSGTETSKILTFDRPVKTVELTREEALRIGHMLIKDKQVRLSQVLHQLIDSGYLSQPKSFVDIREKFQNDGLRVKSASLHVLITNLVKKGQLIREGTRRTYTYKRSEK